uniref:Very-long-chain (3R)-3-hydroxyacyl-CoA dehydratase n=1 Tax=Aegilops tauschii subsp. strangulata TaxID=200361 RepID=A0A453DZK4_AEGTS
MRPSTPPSSGRCSSRRPQPSWRSLSCLSRFVRSPISTTLPQITGRLYITWGILWSFQEAQSHVLVTSLIISWSITEVIRYFFFAMKETFGFAPYWLLWLRYSTFLVFYPTGMLSEAGLILVAMPFMKTSRKYYLMMPNKWNFSIDYRHELALDTALIIPGFPYLFRYMVDKRKKVLLAAKTV